jgi:hypothetical protein
VTYEEIGRYLISACVVNWRRMIWSKHLTAMTARDSQEVVDGWRQKLYFVNYTEPKRMSTAVSADIALLLVETVIYYYGCTRLSWQASPFRSSTLPSSFGGWPVSLLCWHLITLDLPYERYDIKKHTARVVIGGERPSVRRLKGLSDRQRDAIVNGWDTDPSKRPSMEDFCSVLQLELVKRKQNVKKNQRRSTVAGILRRSQIMRDKSSLELGRLGEIVDNEWVGWMS